MSRLTSLIRRYRTRQQALPGTSAPKRVQLTKTKEDASWAEWFNGKALTTDWATHNFGIWATALQKFRTAENVRILEIGSYEGRSAIFFLNYLPKSTIACVDPFTHRQANPLPGAPNTQYERCAANLAEFGDRVTLLAMTSLAALARFTEERATFDIVYIDGAHSRDPVLIDSLLSWPLVRSGGIVIWDDYEWERDFPPERRPKDAIDWFMANHSDATLIHSAYQVIAQKA